MMPPTKDQADIGVDNPTIDASDGALLLQHSGEITENKDMARQEFKQDADLNYMLSRFGVSPARGAPIFGEWDDTLDLQQALTAVSEARAAYKDLPQALRERFKSMEEILTAYSNGSLVIKDGDVPVPPKTQTQLLQERIDELQQRLEGRAPNTTDS